MVCPLLYAPGLYTGYGVKTLPAAREAIEQKEWASARRSWVGSPMRSGVRRR